MIRLSISLGDANGVGPEVILKVAPHFLSKTELGLLVYGSENVLRFYADHLNLPVPLHPIEQASQMRSGVLNVIDVEHVELEVHPGRLSAQAGALAVHAIDRATDACLSKQCDALITAPISKESVNLGGFALDGHTGFITKKCGVATSLMVLAADELRVALMTEHIPIKSVAHHVNPDLLMAKAHVLFDALRFDLNIRKPKIAVLGLNPHAGDGGVIGTEEIDWIARDIIKARDRGLPLHGPFPADGFFGSQAYKNYDAVLAMYHDQGLIPFKTLCFNRGVNVTFGLPIIRTSVDHGTAFSLAGKNKADATSMHQAIDLALRIYENRKRNTVH